MKILGFWPLRLATAIVNKNKWKRLIQNAGAAEEGMYGIPE